MQIRVVTLPGGKLQIFVDDATVEQAELATRQVLAILAAQGIPAEMIGEIEQHKAGAEHVHVKGQMRVKH